MVERRAATCDFRIGCELPWIITGGSNGPRPPELALASVDAEVTGELWRLAWVEVLLRLQGRHCPAVGSTASVSSSNGVAGRRMGLQVVCKTAFPSDCGGKRKLLSEGAGVAGVWLFVYSSSTKSFSATSLANGLRSDEVEYLWLGGSEKLTERFDLCELGCCINEHVRLQCLAKAAAHTELCIVKLSLTRWGMLSEGPMKRGFYVVTRQREWSLLGVVETSEVVAANTRNNCRAYLLFGNTRQIQWSSHSQSVRALTKHHLGESFNNNRHLQPRCAKA